ncbi:hypothetical protein FN846DRAFT_1019459 [Sphaerosporella brunnea]|uniref:J domain-containing protein n=1 Tax=Sphaerosporella brunnea TaxID=1250544 RepID=A0A5J5F5Y7_9PEZI|nr:hypothetical protein FN846DRAFT_1019459 [Sphaerosporella brunnea]
MIAGKESAGFSRSHSGNALLIPAELLNDGSQQAAGLAGALNKDVKAKTFSAAGRRLTIHNARHGPTRPRFAEARPDEGWPGLGLQKPGQMRAGRAQRPNHPEEHREKQTAIFRKIVEAYDVLKDDKARAAYDRQNHDCFTCEVLRTPRKRNKGPSPNSGPTSPCPAPRSSSASTWPQRPAAPYRKYCEYPASAGHQEGSDNWTDSDWIEDEYTEDPEDPEDGDEHAYWK